MSVSGDRIRSCLRAGAVGDAFASAAEGSESGRAVASSSTPAVTDDTLLTLATCRAIASWSRRPADVLAEHVAREFLADFRAHRLVGLGSSTLGALRSLDVGAHWALSGIDGEHAAGNGAAMRIAPLSFVLDSGDPLDRQVVRDVVRVTHRHQEALAGALAMVTALQVLSATPDLPRGELLRQVGEALFDSNVRDNIALLLEHDALEYAHATTFLRPSGYAAHSVPLALVAAGHGASGELEGRIQEVVAHGGDTDTIASMAGQLIGLAAGPRAVPTGLFEKIRDHERIGREIDAFVDHLQGWPATQTAPKPPRPNGLRVRLGRWWRS